MTDDEILRENALLAIRATMRGGATVFTCRRGPPPVADRKKFKCLRCGKKFVGEAAYKEHQCPSAPNSPGRT